MQADGLVGIAEGFLRQPDIAGTVFDQENLYGHTVSSDGFHDSLSISAAPFRGLTIPFALLRQLDPGQPEIIDALHQAVEGLKMHGLAEVAVGLQLIALHDIRFRLGSSQDDGGDRFQARHPP